MRMPRVGPVATIEMFRARVCGVESEETRTRRIWMIPVVRAER